MKKMIFIIVGIVVAFIIIILAVMALRPDSRALRCSIGVGSLTQTTTYEYTRDHITSVETIGNTLDKEDLVKQEIYMETYYQGDDFFELFDHLKSELESDGYTCTIKE